MIIRRCTKKKLIVIDLFLQVQIYTYIHGLKTTFEAATFPAKMSVNALWP